ncbi:peptidoglycan recognition protein family protein [Thermomonospora cellulosilytica]|uniref:N-acetyl-anhydromuramyl-L-alanine amidase AmpD n=1 Tax=Thermomonospora cellulosilytica TaxID=1411118 RepID=A0A7W3MU71_9ACTN|nr:N-acetylmuramoyl-L-alanine amidase [Thermomonospora cellulosilytica]MBA9002000.1 N-acetyl-anhydromuramyl-L-alanine amidase AmpD [Thermomonospora cellulosilytica]
MDIISRGEWGARAPRNRTTTTWDRRTEFIVHYSEGPTSQSVRSIQDFHMDNPKRRWSDIGYNFLVDTKGRIYEGRGWLTVGAHAPDHNTSGIGVCMIGRDGDATEAARKAIRWLYDEACRRAGRRLKILGHRDVYSTSCPGNELYAWVRKGMPVTGSSSPAPSKPSKPSRPGTAAPPFPLPDGHWFGPESSDPRNHSGYWAKDRPHIEKLQRRLADRGWRIKVTGRYDDRTAAVVKAFQAEKGLRPDGLAGVKTWPLIWTAPIT